MFDSFCIEANTSYYNNLSYTPIVPYSISISCNGLFVCGDDDFGSLVKNVSNKNIIKNVIL
jgi:hypothetical protein